MKNIPYIDCHFLMVFLFFLCLTTASCSNNEKPPIDAYHQFWKAVKEKDVQGVRNYLAGMENVPNHSGEWENYFRQMHHVLPTKIVVEKVQFKGLLAYLYVLETGNYYGEKVRQSRKVVMKNVSGNWKVLHIN